MSPRALAVSVLLALGWASASAGVAQAATVPGKTVADAVAAKLSESTQVDVTSMKCPAQVEVRKGNAFTCDGRFASGDRTPVRVTLTDDQGAFKARIVNLLLRHLEDQLEAALLKKQDLKSRVTCPKARKVRTGDKFKCKIKAAGGKRGTFKITQTGHGLVNYEQA